MLLGRYYWGSKKRTFWAFWEGTKTKNCTKSIVSFKSCFVLPKKRKSTESACFVARNNTFSPNVLQCTSLQTGSERWFCINTKELNTESILGEILRVWSLMQWSSIAKWKPPWGAIIILPTCKSPQSSTMTNLRLAKAAFLVKVMTYSTTLLTNPKCPSSNVNLCLATTKSWKAPAFLPRLENIRNTLKMLPKDVLQATTLKTN